MTGIPLIGEEEEKLHSQMLELAPDRFEVMMSNLAFRTFEIETDARSDGSTRGKKKFNLYLGQGRNKARHYAYMALANATDDQQEATELLREIQRNWDDLEHDLPIYWIQGKLAGDFVPEKTPEK